MDLATDSLRQWVVRKLEFMADTVGILQARVLAQYVKTKTPIQEWNTKVVPVKKMLIKQLMESGYEEIPEI
jgi:hypothetical protein